MIERIETVGQLMEILSKQDPDKMVKILDDNDYEDKYYALYVETDTHIVLFK